jgi:hypothetical protein
MQSRGGSYSVRVPFRVRITILLALLAGVSMWAWRDVRRRHERNAWTRPLSVAVVLVRGEPIDASAVEALQRRVPALENRLAEEFHRYRRVPAYPFRITLLGPVDEGERPPHGGGGDALATVRENFALWLWTSRVDRKAGMRRDDYDSRVYVVARVPRSAEREMVEGESEQGGRLGTVEVELDASMADFALFVAAHELFHTLGASDKYDEAGRTLIPTGLAEPDRVPLLPQSFVEVMARNRPVADGLEEPPDRLDGLAVGPTTAREVGWIRKGDATP